jgi:hypothetical protein
MGTVAAGMRGAGRVRCGMRAHRLLDWLLDPLAFPALERFHGGCLRPASAPARGEKSVDPNIPG